MAQMDKERRQALKEQYKDIKIMMGVFQITNTQNGKIYLGACPDLKNHWLTLRMQLDAGRFANAELQRDYTALGPDAFDYAELYTDDASEVVNMRATLKELLAPFMEELQPYGDRGYHKPPVE